jgi:hypothetical protein
MSTGQELVEERRRQRRAGEAFRNLGMDAIADDEPPSREILAAYIGVGAPGWRWRPMMSLSGTCSSTRLTVLRILNS